MSRYVLFLSKNTAAWRPQYVRNRSNFLNKITSYRSRWRSASTANRPGIESNFTRNYKAWLAKVKKANTERRKANQELFEKIRQAKKAGNSAALARLLEKTPSPPKKVSSAPARLSAPARSGEKRNSHSLLKSIHAKRLRKAKQNLRSKIDALEAQRNNLERQINALRREIRSLPATPPHP